MSIFPSFIQKEKMVGLPKVTFGHPNASFSYNSFTNYLIIQKLTGPSHEEGPAWFSKNFLHAAGSAASPSNEWGSKNCMFSLNFSAWFRMASTLAVFKRTYSSKSCTLMAVWPISSLRICSSKALMHCTLASSSCFLFCNISANAS